MFYNLYILKYIALARVNYFGHLKMERILFARRVTRNCDWKYNGNSLIFFFPLLPRYVSGRLHKPVMPLVLPDPSHQLRPALQLNLQSALHVALLLLPETFHEEKLFQTLAGLSYTGCDLKEEMDSTSRWTLFLFCVTVMASHVFVAKIAHSLSFFVIDLHLGILEGSLCAKVTSFFVFARLRESCVPGVALPVRQETVAFDVA